MAAMTTLDDAFDALVGKEVPVDCYFVRDVADIGTKRTAVCPYGAGELRTRASTLTTAAVT
jgi:hypothetical protein